MTNFTYLVSNYFKSLDLSNHHGNMAFLKFGIQVISIGWLMTIGVYTSLPPPPPYIKYVIQYID